MTSTSFGHCIFAVITVVISITHGQNLNSPQFEKPYYQANVSENTRIETPILTVIVGDADTGEEGRLAVSLNDTRHFSINDLGEIVYEGGLDYEKQALREITLSISAIDFGVPPKSTSVPFYVSVLDVNDSPPRFSDIIYRVTVENGTAAGEFVVKLEATDADVNSNLKFNLTEPHAFFGLDPFSGVLTTSKDIDKGSITDGDEINLLVYVSDGLRRNFARITITITDSNFHDPAFVKTLYELEMAEGKADSPIDIITVIATDGDTGDQADITYSLSNTTYSDQFVIGSTSGKIRLKGMIDREMMPEPRTITLNVIATDRGRSPRSSQATVQFNITDIDDNGPKFSEKIYYRTLVKDFPKDDKISLFPQAVDDDEGDNSVVLYDLSPEGAAIFNMDNLTREALTKYSCKIRCPLSDETSFEVILYAWNAKNKSIGGDSATINISLIDPPTTAKPNPGSTDPITTGGSTVPGLTLTELIVIVVVSCVVVLVIFIVLLVLLLRRSKTQRKKDRINFNPSNYPPEKVENEVPCE